MSPARYGEYELVENPAMNLLHQLGWDSVDAFDETLGSSGTLGRDNQGEVVLVHRLRPALRALNPGLPEVAIDQATEELLRDRSAMVPTKANHAVYELLRDGAKVIVAGDDGSEVIKTVRFVDWNNSANNDWLAASQVWITGPLYKRRADIVGFVNGIPLLFIECKASHNKLEEAFRKNIRDYRDAIPHVFWYNGFVLLSNGSATKVGSTYAGWDFFSEWKKINSEGEVGVVSLETTLRGTCEPARFLDIVENFICYQEQPGGLVKKLAKYHQYLGVQEAMEAIDALPTLEGRLGVFWHTQGSGKSLSMLWFTQKVLRKRPGNWTFVMVTDREELDGQLYGEFKDAGVITSAEVRATSGENLRQLLAADHRYVFTLIHKFRTLAGETKMPVLSDRSDVIVLADEAHRTQYDTLALNMRNALPNASFLAFTGTPLMAGEEKTAHVFGSYVSTYSFRDSKIDGATVPLYYENRIPELQIVNESFPDELNEILEAAELDDDEERALSRRFHREYELITRTDRMEKIAEDLVSHFVGRGFKGKGMYVAIDKATAVRMFDFVTVAWASHLAKLKSSLAETPELEQPWIFQQIEFMETTDMAVVVSQGQNEIADMEALGLDIRPHRRRMVTEDMDEKFKDPKDSFRLVFVCAMWMTGFDAPSCSTIYLDRPMRNHTLMQTITRANRVFPDKKNGLIVDYIGVFRDLERALAIYALPRTGESDEESPIREKLALAGELHDAIVETTAVLEANDIDIDALIAAREFEYIALRDSAVEALLVDEETKRAYLSVANLVRRLYKALLPDPSANAVSPAVRVIRNIAQKIASEAEPPDVSAVMDDVERLLDRSVGAEEYVIRAAATGVDPDPVIDLSAIDLDALAARFAGRKHTETEKLKTSVESRVKVAVSRNPTRIDFVHKFEHLLAEYNAGSLNIDEMLRRLIRLSQELTEEERRAVAEDLDEETLAIFDILTRPGPDLSDTERRTVKEVARQLMGHIADKLVLDWRSKLASRSAVRVEVSRVLDHGLPDAYDPALFDEKVDRVFEHLFDSYYGEGESIYAGEPVEGRARLTVGTAVAADVDLAARALSEDVVLRINEDADFARRVALRLCGQAVSFALAIDELLFADENDEVEFKASSRWNLETQQIDKRLELAIVKTVAGFQNARGGTLLIGVNNDGIPVGLDQDFASVRPSSADGYVNWLTTLFVNSMGNLAAARTRIRMERARDQDVCRVDVAAASQPVWVKRSDKRAFYARMNNSTREVTEAEAEAYVSERWPGVGAAASSISGTLS
jgi:type I restriction enzyme R subunit